MPIRREGEWAVVSVTRTTRPWWTRTTYLRGIPSLSGVQKVVTQIRDSEGRIGMLSGVIGRRAGSL